MVVNSNHRRDRASDHCDQAITIMIAHSNRPIIVRTALALGFPASLSPLKTWGHPDNSEAEDGRSNRVKPGQGDQKFIHCDERLLHDVLWSSTETPVTGVQRIIAGCHHHEVMPGRHFAHRGVGHRMAELAAGKSGTGPMEGFIEIDDDAVSLPGRFSVFWSK